MEQFDNEAQWLSVVETTIYGFFIQLYFLIANLSSFFNPKAKQFINGRKETFAKLKAVSLRSGKRYWFHCASLGEFEQARPLIEAIKKRNENAFIALSFFSPSGYEIRKNFPLADVVFYLPEDTKANAEKLITLLQPTQVFWIKYEFWFHILQALNEHKIPAHLVCANFRKEQVFFKSYGTFFRKQLSFFTNIFVQDEQAKNLLDEIGVPSIVAGDTRFDRVCEIAAQGKKIPEIENFAQGKKLLIAGSTWKTDVELLASALDKNFFSEYKLVIAPHDVTKETIDFTESKFSNTIRYTMAETLESARAKTVLILDTTGLLASAYRYGTIAYIGGGFGTSVHNVLEAAVYGLPAIFGNNYKKSREAIELIESRAARAVGNTDELNQALQLFQSPELWKSSSEITRNYVTENSGATEKILSSLSL